MASRWIKSFIVVGICLSIITNVGPIASEIRQERVQSASTPSTGDTPLFPPRENGPPDVVQWLNTEWKEPPSKEQLLQVEQASKANIYAQPSALQANPTEDRNNTVSSARADSGGAEIMSVQDSLWPWAYGPGGSTTWRIDFPALPTAPTMEGRWWPKLDYSTLSFDIPIDQPIGGDVYVWAWIVRYGDIYNRYLTFWFDHNLVSQYVIGSEFKSGVYVPPSKIDSSAQRHLVEISINYGAYVINGWNLLYVWIGIGNTANGKDQKPPLHNN